jgi:hypothetical protein
MNVGGISLLLKMYLLDGLHFNFINELLLLLVFREAFHDKQQMLNCEKESIFWNMLVKQNQPEQNGGILKLTPSCEVATRINVSIICNTFFNLTDCI